MSAAKVVVIALTPEQAVEAFNAIDPAERPEAAVRPATPAAVLAGTGPSEALAVYVDPRITNAGFEVTAFQEYAVRATTRSTLPAVKLA
ncbi:hypothetical protein [Microbacterium trichothecenolyticum]|uniref:Uncharacterized protein n=1 Tax=Microbacterium trichothecenolyticum TaxID=69370 RepID=A0A0M2H7K8_MICTR|nr:hypothetical protein [Microbacterium trichothecenolyticum]KJL39924.1 hypothetical protein RS82_04137 [Microbacterium trichothecenolyticum]